MQRKSTVTSVAGLFVATVCLLALTISAAHASYSGSLISAESDKAAYANGETIVITCSVRNTGTDPWPFNFNKPSWKTIVELTSWKAGTYALELNHNYDVPVGDYDEGTVTISGTYLPATPGTHYVDVRTEYSDGASYHEMDDSPIRVYFTVDGDTTAPSVTIDQKSGQADPTMSSPINFTVVFSEPVVGFETGDVVLDGTAGATTAVVTGSGTTYNVAVSGMTQAGTVIATVPADAAQDEAGNPNTASTSTDNTVTFDNVRPTVAITRAATQASPTNASPVRFTVTFSEPVVGFETGDVVLGGTAAPTTAVVTGSGTTYSVAVSGMTQSGTVVAAIPAGAAKDAAGNNNFAGPTSGVATYDNVRPTVAITRAATQASPTNASPVRFTVTFSEPVVGFETGDVVLGGTAAPTTAVVTGSGTTYSVAVSGMTQSGTVVAAIPAGAAKDAAGNNNLAGPTSGIATYDTVRPTVVITRAATQASPTTTSPVRFTVTFSEPVVGFETGDVVLGGTAAPTTAVVSGSGAVYEVEVSGMTQSGTVVAAIPAGAAKDAAGNNNLGAPTSGIVSYNMRPTVTIRLAATQETPTISSPVRFEVVFSEPVTGFETGDVVLGGTAAPTTAVVTGDGATYEVAVSGMTQSGTVVAAIPAGAAKNAAGNNNYASPTSGIAYYIYVPH